MITYVGRATIILPDGTEVAGRANLAVQGDARRSTWRGDLVADSNAFNAFDNSTELSLRLANGHEIAFNIKRLNPNTPNHVAVHGSGPAPF